MQSGVGQLVAVCGLFQHHGEWIAEQDCVTNVWRLWRRCAEFLKDYAINKEESKWHCKVLDTSQFSMIKYIHDEGNLSETE
jgi:hypothetical protein